MVHFLWWLLAMLLFAGQSTTVAAPAADKVGASASVARSAATAPLPLAPGATWVYRQDAYSSSTLRAQEIVTATFIFTETIVDLVEEDGWLWARVHPTRTVLTMPAGYPQPPEEAPADFWYIWDGSRLFKTEDASAQAGFEPQTASLHYLFPLAIGSAWCPQAGAADAPSVCEYAGMRRVVDHGSYETPAGQFEDCYQTYEMYLSGSPTTWFCNGIGVVAEHYVHSGSPFGYHKMLMEYRVSPK
jgi:hypothetical protein